MSLWGRILDKPRTLAPRRWLFQIHLWVGIIAGLYAIAIGVSGSVLMFREEYLEWKTAELAYVAPEPGRAYASPDEWAATIRKAAGPAGAINFVFPERHGDVVTGMVYRGSVGMRYLVNPYTAELLGVYNLSSGPLHVVDVLHSNLFLGRTGRLINGIGALCLLLMAITGILIWWPGRKLWKRQLTIDPKAGWRRINFDLHHAVGFWSLIGFSVLCVTGAFFTWPQVFRNTVARFYAVTQPVQPKVVRPQGAEMLSFAKLLEAADRAVPEKTTRRAMLPAGGAQPVRVNKGNESDGKPFYRTATTVVLNPYTGEVLRVESPATKTDGDRILSWIGPLHNGNFGGAVVQWIYFFLGLTFPGLFVSGFIMWWLRVVRGRWLAPARQESNRAVSTVSP